MLGTNRGAGLEAGAVDTHCHLFLVDDDPQTVVDGAREAGVERLVCVGIDPASSRTSVELAESFRGVFATAGMHPHTASSLDGPAGAEIEELLANPQVIAVGETGLDHYRMLSPAPDQERAFRLHVEWSRELDKPLVVHVRDAWNHALRVLDDAGAERVVLHCFSGDEAVAREAAARGYFLSFAGNVTYPKNEPIRRAASAVPRERLLVETDSPFLSPQVVRGRDNRPANVVLVIEALAELRGDDPEGLARATAMNAGQAFPGLR
jgi:TatD DNase family protein